MSSPTKATATIEDLPAEMINELFKHLPVKDLVASSQVNKLWHSIYADFRLDRLAAIHNPSICYGLSNEGWKFKQKELCRIEFLNRLADRPLLSNLKYLILYDSGNRFDINKLSRFFKRLVHLEIGGFLGENKLNLNLPKLKSLVVYKFFNNHLLSIDCPELNMLIYDRGEGNLLEVKHPETIKKLEMNMVDQKLIRFENVESLATHKFEAISRATLLSLPNLKELHYNANISSLWNYGSRVGTLDRVKEALREFMGHIERLKGSDFKFMFAGFQLTKPMLDQIDYGVKVEVEGDGREYEKVSNEYIYMNNYQLIEPGALHFIRILNYSRLMNNAPEGTPDCFSQKFSRVEWVHVRGRVQDEAHLLRFLRSLSWLRCLNLCDQSLSQKFYDQLPESAPSLIQLNFNALWHGKVIEKELKLNFDFTEKLPYLSTVHIFRILSLESASSLVRRLGRFVDAIFDFQVKEKFFDASRCCSMDKAWKIYKRGLSVILFQSENSDEIVNYFQTLKSDTSKEQASG